MNIKINSKMKAMMSAAFCLLVSLLLLIPSVSAHCQVPCGIYDDHAEVQRMLLDTTTTRKAIMEIGKLAGKTDAQSQNQLVRWVNNKESHAQNIIASIANYFLTQRVNVQQKDYADRLAKHHAVMVAAMKVKQNASMAHVDALEETVKALLPYYPEHKHE